ncbi:MAG: hypothetical protein RLZZ08_1887 [Pseudomonadota bacterium]|jgi:rod shape-determining protein MreD
MERIDPRSRRDKFGSKINRIHSPALAYSVPWLSIMLASLTPFLPIIAPAPVLPPLAFLLLLGWRFLRPGLLPPWAGLPLGMFDDLYSGQPFGSGILLFSLALLAVEIIEFKFPWRNVWIDWLTAGGLTVAYLIGAALISGGAIKPLESTVIIPQVLISVLLFPLLARVVAGLDRFRLTRIRRIG